MAVIGGAVCVAGLVGLVIAFLVGWPGMAPVAVLVAVIGIQIATKHD